VRTGVIRLLRTWLFLLTTFGAIVLPVAAAQADATWTGASTSSAWSDSTNWSGTTPPTTSDTAVGTLTFPTLGSCGTCYTSTNDVTGVSATSLVLGNSSSQYQIKGNVFTVGDGGINYTPGHGTGDVIKAPIALSDSQTWVVGTPVNNGYNSLTLLGGVTGGSGSAVQVSTPQGDLFVDSDMEAGPVTSEGPGGLHIGGAPGLNEPGSINGSNGQPVTVNGGTLTPNPGSTTGPLSITGGTLLLLGTNKANTDATTLHVNGDATLGSAITTRTYIDNNGSTAGTDFSQLSASGTIALGGTLDLRQAKLNNNTGSCVALTPGDVATLVKADGTLSGAFANAPEGTTLTMASSCEPTPPKLQIHYTSNSVTATVVGDTSTTKLATPSPSPAATNQPVTLTATVTGTSAPNGTVAFLANGATISGCASQPLTTGGSSGTATCQASFPASGSPESLSAAFTPADGSGQGPSTSSPQTLTVNPAATTSTLQASNSSPPAGTSVTYTATVTPGIAGASQPSGTIAFSDGGSPITGCAAQPLTAGSPSPTATCTITYPAAGSHTITATYANDSNFSGSSSSSTTVAIQPTPAPGRSGSTGPAPGIGSGTPRGRAGVVLSGLAQSHSRWRKPHPRGARGARSVPVGTRFTFSVSRAARVTFTFIQTVPGRRLGARCVAPRKAPGRGRSCHRSVTRGRLVRSVGAGAHHLTFHGRIGRSTLPAGSYAVVVTAVAPSGARSRTITLHFTIVA
jgi:hypothetical protein